MDRRLWLSELISEIHPLTFQNPALTYRLLPHLKHPRPLPLFLQTALYPACPDMRLSPSRTSRESPDRPCDGLRREVLFVFSRDIRSAFRERSFCFALLCITDDGGFISRNYVVWPIFFLMNVFIALKGMHFWFLFAFTAAGVVQCGGRKTSPRTSTIVQFIFYFWAFEISVNILRNQK